MGKVLPSPSPPPPAARETQIRQVKSPFEGVRGADGSAAGLAFRRQTRMGRRAASPIPSREEDSGADCAFWSPRRLRKVSAGRVGPDEGGAECKIGLHVIKRVINQIKMDFPPPAV